MTIGIDPTEYLISLRTLTNVSSNCMDNLFIFQPETILFKMDLISHDSGKYCVISSKMRIELICLK